MLWFLWWFSVFVIHSEVAALASSLSCLLQPSTEFYQCPHTLLMGKKLILSPQHQSPKVKKTKRKKYLSAVSARKRRRKRLRNISASLVSVFLNWAQLNEEFRKRRRSCNAHGPANKAASWIWLCDVYSRRNRWKSMWNTFSHHQKQKGNTQSCSI